MRRTTPYRAAPPRSSATPLRNCAACGGFHLGHNSQSFGGVYLCPLHQWSLMHGFNPQPYGTPGGTDQTVKFVDGGPGAMRSSVLHAEGYFPEWCVIGRDGDTLTLRRLGDPDSEPITAQVSQVYPASSGAVYRHASKCGPAPKAAA